MRNETPEQKEKRIFEHYENDLIRLAASDTPPDTLRFIIVEYVCSTPKIDPIKMGKALVDEGIELVFDDSSISRQENEKKCKKVYGRRWIQSVNKPIDTMAGPVV